MNSGIAFSRCGLVAPAMNRATLRSLLTVREGPLPRITILAGTYDIPLIDDARALRKALADRHIPLDWLEAPEGHNHTAWKAQLRRLLKAWYPATPPAPD